MHPSSPADAADIVASSPELPSKSPGRYRVAFARMLRHRLGVAGMIVFSVVVLAAVFAPLLAPHDPAEIFYDSVLTAPSGQFFFGTEEIGRDVFSRIVHGARVSLQIMLVSIVAAVVLGSLLGLISGYVGGWVDHVIMRIMDGMLAFPMLVLALGIISILGPSLVNTMIAISIVNIPNFALLVRAQVLSVKELEFVQAARALGAGDFRIMWRHIWPSVVGNVIVYSSLRASTALITESSLAFLGLGAQPPTPSWGQMLSTAIQYPEAWWISVFPGAVIFLTVMALNFVGDSLRDALDVRLST
jgi:peptide/nickel transport system permease protein